MQTLSTSQIAIVTGANKGIGLAIVRNLALQHPTSPLKSGPLCIYLTARSAERGAEAVRTLQDDPRLREAKVLAADGGDTSIVFHQLDIDQDESIREFRDFLQTSHPTGIDFVINNAGRGPSDRTEEATRKILATNYHGTLAATQSLLPLIRSGGRLVNVSSSAGKLIDVDVEYSEDMRQAFVRASETGVPAVTELMNRFQSAVAAGEEVKIGFPDDAYSVSKAGVTGMTKAIATEEAKRERGILVNVCCPGFVNTDMTRGHGTKSPDEGAMTPVMLALDDIGGKTGTFWRDEEEIDW